MNALRHILFTSWVDLIKTTNLTDWFISLVIKKIMFVRHKLIEIGV